MRLKFLLLSLLTLSLQSYGKTLCTLEKKVPEDSQGRNLYLCKEKNGRFKARCNGSTDAEFKTPPFKSGVWEKVGDGEGIVFKGGAIQCEKVK